jgi:hypothetical protein
MHRAVIKRKNRVLKHINTIRSLKPAEQTNESMCGCYVLAFGALEYMIETLIRGWIQSNVRKHKHPYRGKSQVDIVIAVLGDLAEQNLKHNNGISYSKICELVEKLSGAGNKQIFKRNIETFPGGVQALQTAIARIETTRHNVAHGALWPDEISPNLNDLEQDFMHVYSCLVVTLNTVLPRY